MLIYFLSSPQFLFYIYCVHSILSANTLNTDCVSVKYEIFKPIEKKIYPVPSGFKFCRCKVSAKTI